MGVTERASQPHFATYLEADRIWTYTSKFGEFPSLKHKALKLHISDGYTTTSLLKREYLQNDMRCRQMENRFFNCERYPKFPKIR